MSERQLKRLDIEEIPTSEVVFVERLCEAFGWSLRKWYETDDPAVLADEYGARLTTKEVE